MFSENIFRDRISKLQKSMKEWNIDLLAILDVENYVYFTGELRKQPRLYVPADGEPIILAFRGEKDEVSQNTWIKNIATYSSLHEMMVHIINLIKERNITTIGFDYEFALPAFLLERFRMANPTVKVVDARELFMNLRMIKSSDEISLVKKAEEIATVGVETARQVIKEGITEVDVVTEIEYAMRKKGAERFSFSTIVNSGYRSNSLHGWATGKKISKGELVLVDMGPVYMGYSGDMTRMFVVGSPTEKQKKLVNLYLRARNAAVEAAKPNAMMTALDEAANKVVAEAGFGEYYVRGIAHGIGLAFEERPFPTIFPEDYIVELKRNVTLAVGHSILSLPGIGGARVEEIYVVGDSGAKPLVKYNDELITV